jgi:valyl-tRNA synthetase
MRVRYEHWVEGLNGDWLISRQRFFGVPLPLWYPVAGDGTVDHDHPIIPDEGSLPVDPSSDTPPGYDESQRGEPGGFAGDGDVMDTWATSSLTPQIATGWGEDDDLFNRTFPMDLRPQGPEIIRTWLFATVLRSHLEHDALPWRHASINGWILDPDRKKMSKSKGNVVTPVALLEQYSSDAVRYWAASARPGTDTAFDEGQMKVGRRLAIKILNASKFVLSRLEGDADGEVTNPLDRSMLGLLGDLVHDCTRAFDSYDYSRALEHTEQFFWDFCDNYLELVKGRAYGAHGPEEQASANASLTIALGTLLRLFAPHLPFVTEEVWSWWQEGSIHRAGWPDAAELRELSGAVADSEIYATAAGVLSEIRKAKTEAKQSLKADVARVEVVDTPNRLVALAEAETDLKEAGNVAELITRGGDALAVTVTLAGGS